MKVIANIQVLRGFAAFLVVLLHARLLTPIGDLVSFHFGNSGVDIFFVISGFIIGHVTNVPNPPNPRVFLLKRFVRVAPLYWALTLAVFLGGQLAPSLAGAAGVPATIDLLRSLAFVPYFDATGEIHPVLFMGWTLNYEVFFYLLFGLTLLLGSQQMRIISLSLVMGALVLAGLVLTGPALPSGQAAWLTYTDPILLEFVAGMWLALWYRALPERPLQKSRGIAWSALLGASIALLVAADRIAPEAPRVLAWGLPSILIVTATLRLDRGGWRLGNRFLLLLGDASYSLYLTHVLVIKVATVGYQKLGVQSLAIHMMALFMLYAACILVAIAVHRLVERPLTRVLQRHLTPGNRPLRPAITGDRVPTPV